MSLTTSIDLDDVVNKIHKAASESVTEEDLRIRVESILHSSVLEPLDIPLGRYEYSTKYNTLISGVRIDALHAHVVLEYEKPGSFNQRKNYEHAIQQVKNGIRSHANNVPERFPRYFGVVLDGFKIGFVRYRQRLKDFEVSREPLDVNKSTIARLIEAIIGLRRKALGADELLKDFGPDSGTTKKVIKVFYNRLSNKVTERTSILFNDWKRVFSQVCAYDLDKLKGLEEQYGFQKGKADVEKLLFALHTYLALLMKLLAAEVVSLYLPTMVPSYLRTLEDAYYKGHEELKDELKKLEEGGGIFSQPPLLITNFLEADYFGWYIDEWDKDMADSLALMIRRLADYDPSTTELEPERVKDLFKRLYQNLVPRKIRHDLGEYYTPDWLAELVLNETGFTLEQLNKVREEKKDVFAPLDLRLLDPACGSGTFLVLALARIKEYIEEHWVDKRIALEKIVKNVVGFDLNPLAVMASRANYLIAIGDMLREKNMNEPLEIPVYLADSIMVKQIMTVVGADIYCLNTVAGNFEIPVWIVKRELLDKVLSLIETCARNYTTNEFLDRLQRELKIKVEEAQTLQSLYETISKLEKEGKDRIWLRVLRNSFAPFLKGQFDYIVGNPPWVNWENLADELRPRLKDLYEYYNILPKNQNAQTKVDLSMVFVYRCIDRYLKDGGYLGFLINDAAFKAMAGNGFRKFRISINNVVRPFKVKVIHDLVAIKPFEGASNRTAMFVAKKGEVTKFPILYNKWFKSSGEISQTLPLEDIRKVTKVMRFYAKPLKGYKSSGEVLPLLPLSNKKLFNKLNKVIGKSSYVAHEGASLLPAGVFRVRVLDVSDKYLLIENLAEKARVQKKINKVQTCIERDLVFPMLESADVVKWKVRPKNYCIIPYDLTTGVKVFDESKLKILYPKAYTYFTNFKDQLKQRSDYKSYAKNRLPYYFVYRFSEYTIAPYKVLWNQMGNELAAAVARPVNDPNLGNNKVPIPEHVLAFISTSSEEEAHYICAILNSSITNLVLQSIAKGGKNFATPEFINNIKIERYDPSNPIHKNLVELSKKAHSLACQDRLDELRKVEDEIDKTVAKLYGITDMELKEIQKGLNLLEGQEIVDDDEKERERES